MTPKSIQRRNFIKSASALSLASFFGLLPSLRAETLPLKRVGGPFLKTSLNAYSFDGLLKANLKDSTKGLDLFSLCEFAAQNGFSAVDLTGYYFPDYPNVPNDAYINRLKKHLHALGLNVSGTGIRNDFTSADKKVREEGVRVTKSWIEVAAKLGAPVIRVFADSQSPSKNWKESSGNAKREEVESWMVECFKSCATHAESFGVILGIQNHGDFISSGAEHLHLLNAIDSPWCGAIVDTGRYITSNPYDDISLMAPYAVNWQIKTHVGNKATSARTDLTKLVGIIRTSGYRGFLPIETLSLGRNDYNPLEEVPVFHAQLRKAISELSS
jgi:sugar phosphate isomerase/epimerase